MQDSAVHALNWKGGAQPGNRNRLRHGLRTGRLPAHCSYITRATDELRRQLEDEVVKFHGELDVYHAAVIQSIIRHERRAQLLQKWLRDASRAGAKPLTIMEGAQLLRDISAATESRNRALRELGLNNSENRFARIYAGVLNRPNTALRSHEASSGSTETDVSVRKNESLLVSDDTGTDTDRGGVAPTATPARDSPTRGTGPSVSLPTGTNTAVSIRNVQCFGGSDDNGTFAGWDDTVVTAPWDASLGNDRGALLLNDEAVEIEEC